MSALLERSSFYAGEIMAFLLGVLQVVGWGIMLFVAACMACLILGGVVEGLKFLFGKRKDAKGRKPDPRDPYASHSMD